MDFRIDIPEIDIDLDLGLMNFDNRYQKAKRIHSLPEGMIKYSNAEKLAKSIDLDKKTRYNCIVAGNFIFGDFIEAFIVENNCKCLNVTISTLSMDQNNVDSLHNLITGEFIEELDIIISDYFYAHERGALIPYIYRHLDIDNKFQLAVAGTHTKICLIKTLGGKHIVIHGSANLRSSSNIEQFTIEENKDLYDFYLEYHELIIDEYKTINKNINKQKSLRGKKLWETVEGEMQDIMTTTETGYQGQGKQKQVRENQNTTGVKKH